MAYVNNDLWTGVKWKVSQTPRHDTEFAFEFIVICGATLFPEVKQLRKYISPFSDFALN